MPRFFAAIFACLTGLLWAAPGAFANSDIEVVAGNTLTNNDGAPTSAPTDANSQIGADLRVRVTAGLSTR